MPYMGYGMYGFYDWTYILVFIGVGLSLLASAKVKGTFNRYANVMSSTGYTGADIANRILAANDMRSVEVNRIAGSLTDHFDPRRMTVSLSETVYGSRSIAAIAVASHECGHVLQHKNNYFPYNIRHALVPVVNFGSSISWFLILAGIFLGGYATGAGYGLGGNLISLGIFCFSLAVIFQLVTLPVEFNASRRALNILRSSNQFSHDELAAAKKVLSAAALTYVAGATASILQLLRLILIFGGRRRD